MHDPDNIVQLAASRMFNDVTPQPAKMAGYLREVFHFKESFPEPDHRLSNPFAVADPFVQMNPIPQVANPCLTGSRKNIRMGMSPTVNPIISSTRLASLFLEHEN